MAPRFGEPESSPLDAIGRREKYFRVGVVKSVCESL
jgi:hypothetical protein